SPGVSFTSQPTTSALLAHYVVSPAGAPIHAGSASNDDSLAPKWPKGHGPASLVGNTGGVSAGNGGSAAGSAATPGTTASFIGQQGSATTCSYFGTGCNPPDMAIAASAQS